MRNVLKKISKIQPKFIGSVEETLCLIIFKKAFKAEHIGTMRIKGTLYLRNQLRAAIVPSIKEFKEGKKGNHVISPKGGETIQIINSSKPTTNAKINKPNIKPKKGP